jgi:small conductance mechanosensitive channel
LISWILSKVVRKAVKKAIENIRSASELLKDFIVNISGKAIFLVGCIVALSMLEVNIGPLLAAIGAAGFIMMIWGDIITKPFPQRDVHVHQLAST